jgi:hypothetical protein
LQSAGASWQEIGDRWRHCFRKKKQFVTDATRKMVAAESYDPTKILAHPKKFLEIFDRTLEGATRPS